MVGRRSRSRVRKFVRAPSKGTSDGGVRYAVNSHPIIQKFLTSS
jgi:hypothetical protein